MEYTYPTDRPPNLPRLDKLVHADDMPYQEFNAIPVGWGSADDARLYGGGIARKLGRDDAWPGMVVTLRCGGYGWRVGPCLFLPRALHEDPATWRSTLR